jgi:long-chain acyl-CoA synthetase
VNIGRLADDNIQRFGEYEFLHFAEHWHTNVEMNRTANKLANALKDLGVKKGDRVGVQLLNCPELIESFFAIFKTGAILVPINPSLRVADLAYIYQDAGLCALISSTVYADNIQGARKNVAQLRHVIFIEEKVPDDALSFGAIIKNLLLK